jgi:CP12 domain
MSEDFSLEESIEHMKAETVTVCSEEGVESTACAVRLEILEEMRAARFHRNMAAARKALRDLFDRPI